MYVRYSKCCTYSILTLGYAYGAVQEGCRAIAGTHKPGVGCKEVLHVFWFVPGVNIKVGCATSPFESLAVNLIHTGRRRERREIYWPYGGGGGGGGDTHNLIQMVLTEECTHTVHVQCKERICTFMISVTCRQVCRHRLTSIFSGQHNCIQLLAHAAIAHHSVECTDMHDSVLQRHM